MEQVLHHGRATAYRVADPAAAGPTTLYVHGSGSNHRVWGHQYGPDGPAHPAVALDLSGHGESDDIETEPGPETLSAYVDDVAAVARETGADVIVGHSLGGAVVLQLLLDGVHDPAGAVFADTGAKLAVHEEIRRLLAEDFPALVDLLHRDSRLLYGTDEPDENRTEDSDAPAEDRAEDSNALTDVRVVDHSREALLSAGQRVTHRDFLTCHSFDVRDRLAELSLPALAIVGEHDSLTPPAYLEFLAEHIEGCRMATVEDAAHLSMLEQPRAFNRALAAFCERIEGD